MTLATRDKSAQLPAPTIGKERAQELTAEIFDLGDKIGAHLAEIRDNRGFQHLGYKDFVTYCKTEFGYGKSRAYQLIQESQIEESLRKDSVISEKERLTSSHYSALANNVAPEDRGKVLSYAKVLANIRGGKEVTALDIKAAAITINNGIPNKQSKWAKPLSRLGLEKGSQVIVNPGLPTTAKGIIQKVRDDGRVEVYLYGFNTTIAYSFSDIQLTEPLQYIPLFPEDVSNGQSVRIFSDRLNINDVEGKVIRTSPKQVLVEVDGQTYGINYEELADSPKAANQIVDVESYSEPAEESTVVNRYPIPPFNNEAIDENWVRRHQETLINWLADNADDRQRLEIVLALIENLTPEGKRDAEQLFTNNEGHILAEEKIKSLEQEIEKLKGDISALRKETDVASNQLEEAKEKQQNNSRSMIVDQSLKVKEKSILVREKFEQELESKITQLESSTNSKTSEKLKTEIRLLKERLKAFERFIPLEIGQKIGIKGGRDKATDATVTGFSFLGAIPDVKVSVFSNSGKLTEQSFSMLLICDAPEPEPAENYNQELELFKQVEEFERELIPYLAKNGLAKNPPAYANTVCKGILKGDRSPLFENFLAGRPLGGEVKQDWEIALGEPYPAFKEDRINFYVQKGEPIEQATLKVANELRNYATAQPLWEGFLRKTNRLADNAIKAKELGVENPYLPAAFTEQETVTKQDVFDKLESLNQQKSLPEKKPTLEELRKNFAIPAARSATIKAAEYWGYKVADLGEAS